MKYILGVDIPLQSNIDISMCSDGSHTFKELYDHRIANFLTVMILSNFVGLKCGWSKRHFDGDLCFGGGWVICWVIAPSGKQARYHMLEDKVKHLKEFEHEIGNKWNGREETIDALNEIVNSYISKN